MIRVYEEMALNQITGKLRQLERKMNRLYEEIALKKTQLPQTPQEEDDQSVRGEIQLIPESVNKN
jgi:phage-related baseplate assembly protein